MYLKILEKNKKINQICFAVHNSNSITYLTKLSMSSFTHPSFLQSNKGSSNKSGKLLKRFRFIIYTLLLRVPSCCLTINTWSLYGQFLLY